MLGIARILAGRAEERVLEAGERITAQLGDEDDVGRVVDAQRRGIAQRVGNAPAPQVFARADVGGLGSRRVADPVVALDQQSADRAMPQFNRGAQPDRTGADDEYLCSAFHPWPWCCFSWGMSDEFGPPRGVTLGVGACLSEVDANSAVIAGLDPAIHPLRKKLDAKMMDPRVKPAGDTGASSRSPKHAQEPQACPWPSLLKRWQNAVIDNNSVSLMKLAQLRHMMAVAERGSLRAAARDLGVAQPAVTRSIRELEREFGVVLFERHS